MKIPFVVNRTRATGSARVGVIIVLTVALLFPAMVIYGISSFFMLSSPTRALRDAVTAAVGGQRSTRVALNVGPMTIGLARLGISFFQSIPPEAKLALSAARGAEVGVYRVPMMIRDVDCGAVVTKADQAMAKRGWTRVVGVSERSDLVAVYMPKNCSSSKIQCCVLVWHDEDLVVVSARVNPQPLIELATQKIQQEHPEFLRSLAGPRAHVANPNSELRNPKQIRNAKSETRSGCTGCEQTQPLLVEAES